MASNGNQWQHLNRSIKSLICDDAAAALGFSRRWPRRIRTRPQSRFLELWLCFVPPLRRRGTLWPPTSGRSRPPCGAAVDWLCHSLRVWLLVHSCWAPNTERPKVPPAPCLCVCVCLFLPATDVELLAGGLRAEWALIRLIILHKYELTPLKLMDEAARPAKCLLTATCSTVSSLCTNTGQKHDSVRTDWQRQLQE